MVVVPSCGASVDRETTLSRLREAMQVELPPGEAALLEEHNQLVLTVRDGNVLDGMRRFEVEEAIGRGENCGVSDLCARHDFQATDWIYEVGRRDGTPWGPTLIIGFDRQGIVEHVFTLTRH